jgi:serine/threonine protein kinase
VLVPDRGPCLLTGLGLAPPFSDAASTRWVEVAGTPSCVAPEQAKLHGSSPAADLWSLGATLYFAVEGSHAFTGASPAEILDAIANGEPRRPSHARELGPLLERLLVEDPEGRPDADEVRRELAHVAGIAVAEEAPAPSRRRGWRRARPSPAEPETGPETVDVEPEVSVEEAGRDWNAVVEDRDVDGTAADGNLSWVDWSPFDTSPPSAEPAASEAEPAPTADVPPEPAAAVPPASPEEEPPRYRSTPSWPPPARRRVGVTILCALVTVVLLGLLITDGRIGRSNARTRSTVSGQERPVLATDPASVPASWIAYHHPVVDFGISYPPGWTIREEGPVVTIREPTTGTELRVDYKQPPGEDPQRTWTNLESSFSTRHPGDYRRLQLSPATYLGHPAALWEFTYADGTVPAHAVDLGFLTKKYRFALYFQAPAATWDSMLPVFRAFLSSVQAPK